MKPDRVQAFSDGIFAILITILVLEFKLPKYTAGHLVDSVIKQWPILFSYILTYSYIGFLWLFHHDLFSKLKVTTIGFNIINLFSIFLITLLNYVTLLLAETISTENTADMRFAFGLYDVVAFLISLSFIVYYMYLYNNPKVLKDTFRDRYDLRINRYPLTSMSLYLLAFLLNYVQVYLGLLFLILGMVFHSVAYFKTSRIIHGNKKVIED
ncbi:TMEM175 family protein [Companilactobacillus sp. DQM5]|uniref:TMEM175 family protein n=1 Tax=Companilactobacillus sp. DQM5 TaxID=3463359 RepID=UPI004059CF2E